MFKKIMPILIFSLILQAGNFYKVDLYKYTEIVSANAKVNILIDNKVKANKISFYIPKLLHKKDYINSLSDLLLDQNLTLIKKQNYYYITFPKKKLQVKKLYMYKFNSFNIDNIDLLKSFFPSIKFQYFRSQNILYFKSTKDIYLKILKICKKLDKFSISKKISMSIYLINFTEAKKYGFEIQKFGLSLNNLISFTQKSISLSSNNLLAYQSAIDFLQSKGVVTILQNPILNLTDSQKVKFESVTNLPYLVSSTSVKDNTVSTQKNIQYKDVGLKIDIFPRIFKHYMFLKLNLVSENLLNKSDTPTTSKITYNNTFKLDNNSSLLLTGLNVINNSNSGFKVPVLGDIPIINPLFNTKKTTKQNRILTILIKIL